jgi:hypothetical protein
VIYVIGFGICALILAVAGEVLSILHFVEILAILLSIWVFIAILLSIWVFIAFYRGDLRQQDIFPDDGDDADDWPEDEPFGFRHFNGDNRNGAP